MVVVLSMTSAGIGQPHKFERANGRKSFHEVQYPRIDTQHQLEAFSRYGLADGTRRVRGRCGVLESLEQFFPSTLLHPRGIENIGGDRTRVHTGNAHVGFRQLNKQALTEAGYGKFCR